MANNCLVTKLKRVVDNNNLCKLGELHVHINNLAEATAIDIRTIGHSNLPMRIVGDGYFIDKNTGDNLGKNVVTRGGFDDTLLSPGTYDLFVSGKNDDLYYFRVNNSAFEVENNTCEYMLGCNQVSTSFVVGNVERIVNTININIEEFGIFMCPSTIYLNLQSLQRLTNLRTLTLAANPGVTGNLSDLLPISTLRSINLSFCVGINGDASVLLDEQGNKVLPNLVELIISNSGISISNETKAALEAAGVTVS